MNIRHRRNQRRQRVRIAAEEYQERASDLFVSSDLKPSDERKILEAALVKAKRSLLLDPENYATLVLLGHIYSTLDDPQSYAHALRYYERAIALQPRSGRAYEGKADVLMYGLDQPEEAERFARKAVAVSLRSGEESDLLELRYMTLIDILEARRKFPQVRWIIRQALRRCPSEFMKDTAEGTLRRIDLESKRT